MLQFLLPKEDKFYRLLSELEQMAGEASQLLNQLIQEPDAAKAAAMGESISKLKTKAKVNVKTLTRQVCQTLITPFDREDIQEIALELYDIVKLVEKIKNIMLRHNLSNRDNDFGRFAELIYQGSSGMNAVMKELSGKLNTQTISSKVAVLDEIEDKGDLLLDELLQYAMNHIEDTREWIMRKDLYAMLEDVTDLYRDAANVALRIVLKHS